jgi:hypothetical protein
MRLGSYFPGSSWGNYYGTWGGESGHHSGGGNSGSTDPTIFVDQETQDEYEAIEVGKFINCFNAIPDAGSTCTIEIAADIPVDGDPRKFYDFNIGSPGHVFITIRKSNGSQQAVQHIGFYPKSGYKASTYAPTGGKLVDNAKHEFNASLKMNVTPAQFSSTLLRIQQLANLNYDVDEYNCADWALDIFNHTRTNKLEIPLYGIPGSTLTQHTRTPQGLYNKLQGMVSTNDPEKGNITIGIYKGYAGGSTGPCN